VWGILLHTNHPHLNPNVESDDLLSRAYDTAVQMGWLSHLMLALSASLQQAALDVSSTNLNDASLQAYAMMSRKLGCLMPTLMPRLVARFG